MQITFRGIDPSPALSELIEHCADELRRISDRIHSLRVLVEEPHRHHRHGNHFRVRIELTMPGHDIVVGNDNGARAIDEDAYAAVRRAFDVVRRRLTAAQARGRGKERAHAADRATVRNTSRTAR